MTSIELENIFFSLKDFKNDKVQGHKIKYDKEKIAGEFVFKLNKNCKRHCILVSSRFNEIAKRRMDLFQDGLFKL